MKIVLASENVDKVKEIQTFMSSLPVNLVPQSIFNVPEVEETGLSFIENAILKARHASKHTDMPALADDSGLAVDALGGAPGIFSARYAGNKAGASENIDKLLAAIATLTGEDRKARFHCAIAFVRHYHDPIPIVCQAQWEGEILPEPVGKGGFGYDPIFYIPPLKCTAAELAPAQKNTLSHRAKALSAFRDQLGTLYQSKLFVHQEKT